MRPLGSPPFKQTAWRKFKCKVCGAEFKCSRADREYCGATCRQRERRLKIAAAGASAGTPKLHSMEVANRADPGNGSTSRTTAEPVARSAGKPKKKPTRSTTRSTTRSKPSKKGGRKK